MTISLRSLMAVLFFTQLFVCACGKNDEEPSAKILSVSVRDNPYSVLGANLTAQTDVPARVYVEYGEGWEKRTSLTPTGTVHEIEVVGLRAETQTTLRAVAVDEGGRESRGEQKQYLTGAIPHAIPDFAVTQLDPTRTQPGIVFFSPRKRLEAKDILPVFFGVDEEGEVVWYYYNDHDRSRFLERTVRGLENGNLLLTMEGGLRIITVGGRVIHEINARKIEGLDYHHDAILLPDGNYVFIGDEQRTVPVDWSEDPQSIIGDLLIETDADGNLIRRWSAFDHLDTRRNPYGFEDGEERADWTHANSVVYDRTDDSFLLSARHQGWILKIDRQSGEIVWRLGKEGDFALEEGSIWFTTQHAPEIQSDGSILLYDNGLYRDWIEGDWFSRAVHYQIDAEAMTAQTVWEYRTDYFTPMVGDVDRLANGNVLVCAGGQLIDAQPAQIVEVTPDSPSEAVWRLDLSGWVIYRAEKLPSLYFGKDRSRLAE